MNKHSIKVPRLYKVSAQVAKEVNEGLGSVKSIVYEKQKKHPNIKAIYALVSTLFQKTNVIETLLKRSQIFTKEPKLEAWLAKVLLVELLWGKGSLPGQSKPEQTIRAYEQIFKAHLSDNVTEEINFKENAKKPRYVRVNTILANLNEAIDFFINEGYTLVKFLDKTDYTGYLEKIVSLNESEFMVDIHVPNLLVFSANTTFYNHPAYKNGSIILQDKASCLPVHILGPPPGSIVLDMCAAPGMKTTHLAAVLNNQGTVYATERNPKRFESLSRMIETSGATCVQTFNQDILECTKANFPGVEYILVDPSCSGTGMIDRSENNEVTPERLRNLTGFQIKILRHALTKFPDAKRVVYSTCSLLQEENEDVVRQVLETNYMFKLISAKELVGDSWKNFGCSEYGDIGKYCLYAKPKEDHTNGFFVAAFERLKEGEENQFFNTKIFNFKKHVQANEKWKAKKQKKYEEQDQIPGNENFGKRHKKKFKMGKDENDDQQDNMINNIESWKKMKPEKFEHCEMVFNSNESVDKKVKRKHKDIQSEDCEIELDDAIGTVTNSEHFGKKNKKERKEILDMKKKNYINETNDPNVQNDVNLGKKLKKGIKKTGEKENENGDHEEVNINENVGKKIKKEKKKRDDIEKKDHENKLNPLDEIEIKLKKTKQKKDQLIDNQNNVESGQKVEDNNETKRKKKNKVGKYQELENVKNFKYLEDLSEIPTKRKKIKVENQSDNLEDNEICKNVEEDLKKKKKKRAKQEKADIYV